MVRGFLLILCLSWSVVYAEPLALYLTWQQDPSTTMTIRWITQGDQKKTSLKYKKSGSNDWTRAEGQHFLLHEDHPYVIHHVELTQLLPDTRYTFRLHREEERYRFRTLSDEDGAPFHFVVCGDLYQDKKVTKQMFGLMANTEPMFALLGGDLAYANQKRTVPRPESISKWLKLLSLWKENMITPKGNLVPLVPAIGNHDVKGGFGKTPEQAKCFYSLFPMPGLPGYAALDFGKTMSVFILDSDHTNPIEGAQTDWLSHALEERADVLHKFALYHFPIFPCTGQTDLSHRIYEHWGSLFEKHSLSAAFEHHKHAYKITHPIRDGKVDPSGVLYIGDGGLGILGGDKRTPKHPDELWYLAKTQAKRHFIVVDVTKEFRRYSAIGRKGKAFDTFTQKIP